MRRAFFFIVVLCLATSSFASIPRASMPDRVSEHASAFAQPLPETRVWASEVLAPYERQPELTRALRQAYLEASTTNASGLGRFLSVDPVLDLKKTIPNPQMWNRYAYVLNNPVRFTDPTGKYTCTGWASECKAFEASLLVLKAAASEAARKRIPGATRLNDLVKLYGNLGQDNGVRVEFGRTKSGAMATSMDPKTSVVTIKVDRTSLASMTGPFQVAVAQAHEGDHGLNMRADPSLATSRSRQDRMWLETNAYRTQGYVNSALGVEDSYWQIWTNQNGFDLFQITSWATESVAGACSHEPCTP
jgi:hypothetical protein